MTCFLNRETNDYLILNKYGTHFVKIDDKVNKQAMEMDSCDIMMHSIRSVEYLKVGDENMIEF